MTYADDAIHVYIDGSYVRETGAQAYGWVVANPTGSMLPARVIAPEACLDKYASTKMEIAAFIDALAEFACRRRPIVIHGDCTSLADLIDKYRAGVIDTSYFFGLDYFREEDAWRLLSLIDAVDFSFVWVKGHSDSFLNSVVDQALRIITNEGNDEAAGTRFALDALASGEAVVYGRCPRSLSNKRDFKQGFKRIEWLADAA